MTSPPWACKGCEETLAASALASWGGQSRVTSDERAPSLGLGLTYALPELCNWCCCHCVCAAAHPSDSQAISARRWNL